jgi:hypothetical protein
MVIAKDEVLLSRYGVSEQLMKLPESISSELLKTLVLDYMSIADKVLLLHSSRFPKIEYLRLLNCTIDNLNIYEDKLT